MAADVAGSDVAAVDEWHCGRRPSCGLRRSSLDSGAVGCGSGSAWEDAAAAEAAVEVAGDERSAAERWSRGPKRKVLQLQPCHAWPRHRLGQPF